MWPEVRLADVARAIQYGFTAAAIDDASLVRFVRITDITSGQINWASVPGCQIDSKNLEKYRLREGDVVVARTGASAGSVALYSGNHDAVFASFLIRIQADTKQLDDRFLSAVLHSPRWWDYVARNSGGSAQPQFNGPVLREFSFALPPIEEQRRISSILAVLDEKIDSNRRLADLLMQTAATLFRARFVKFVGVDGFEESRIGPIPRGWTVAPIGDVVTVKGGSTPSTKQQQYWDGENCWATPKDLAGARGPILLETRRRLTDLGVEQISSRQMPPRTVLLSSRAPVGYTAMSFCPISVNQGFIAIPPSSRMPSEFVLFWIRENLDLIKQHAGGTTFAEISKSQFRPLPMVVPPRDELDSFAAVAVPVFNQIAGLEKGIGTLVALRDALLPNLLSGAVRVPDISNGLDIDELAAGAVR